MLGAGSSVFGEQSMFLVAMGLFAIAAVWLVIRRAVFSPQFVAALGYLLLGTLTLFPQLYYSEGRASVLAKGTQSFLLVVAATFLLAAFYTRRPRVRTAYPPVRWRFFSLRGWLSMFFLVCLADPMVSIALTGNVGILMGNQGMGRGGSIHTDAFTPITFIAWACAAMAATMVLTEFLFSGLSFREYRRRRWPHLLLLAGCFFFTGLSGNRFILIFPLACALIGLGLFGRIRPMMLAAVAVLGTVFFVAIGNFRFGAVDIVDNLRVVAGIGPVDLLVAWVASYAEPGFPNLDNFLVRPPSPTWGMAWLSSVLPSALVDAFGLDRINSGIWLADNSLYAYRGLTFRTMYPDLIIDFGRIGALMVGGVIFLLSARAYNRALASPSHFVFFTLMASLLLWSPLLASFYQAQTIAAFALLFFIRRTSIVSVSPTARTE
jgi:oligosaccharide repeat unit polymerase